MEQVHITRMEHRVCFKSLRAFVPKEEREHHKRWGPVRSVPLPPNSFEHCFEGKARIINTLERSSAPEGDMVSFYFIFGVVFSSG